MASGANSSGLGFSDPYPLKKNLPTGYSFSVTDKDFILNSNPPG
jgi:hypothetical protein